MIVCRCLLAVIAACRPDWQELYSELMRASVVYTDSREACLKESDDIILSEVIFLSVCLLTVKKLGHWLLLI